MARINDLLRQHCPEGVKLVNLRDYIDIHTGKQFNKSAMLDEGPYAVLNGGINPSGYSNSYNTDENTITISQGGASAGYVNWMSNKFWAGAHCFVVSPTSDKICNRFLYFYLKENQPYLMQSKQGAGIPGLNRSKVQDLKFPLIPVAIQEKIVEILNNFDRLSAELQAELQARKEQYEYYRNHLLTHFVPEQTVTEYSLGELFVFKNGLNASKEQFGHGNPIVNYVNVYKKCSITAEDLDGKVDLDPSAIERYNVKKGDVFFTRTSETQEEVGIASVLLEDIENCVFSGFVLRARPTTDVLLPEFCKYCFSTDYIRKQIIRSSTLTTRALTNGTSLSKVKLLVPTKEKQKQIVSILDKFEELVNDLSQGLPAEIAAVQEQYEYYRNKLLTFNEIA